MGKAQIIPFKNPKPPFEDVYQRYYQEVLGYVYKKLGNRQDAEDLTADAFLYGYQNYEKYDPSRSSVATWLFLIVNSRIKNHYRDRKQTVDYSELENWLFADETDMERTVYLEQLREFISETILDLPERQQKIVLMRYFQNLEFSEIAEEMGTSAGNVRVILSRALARLEEKLKESITDWSFS